METKTIVRGSGGERRATDAGLDARWPGQCQMIRAAQIAFDGSVLDCALLDTSRGGARVLLLAPAEVPGIATLRLDGASWTLQRQWQRGSEVGFKVVGGGPPPASG